MAQKFRFFTAKRRNDGSFLLYLRTKQIASIWKYGSKFVAGRADVYGLEDGFETIAQAEEFVWRNWV